MSMDTGMTKGVKTPQEREVEKMLVAGEELLLVGKLHVALYWKAVAILIFAFLMIFMIPPFAMLFGIVGVLWLIVCVLTQHYLLLAVTSKRILVRQGLLQMDVVDIRLSKIESIDLERMLPGHLFGYANVVIMGTGQRLIRIPYIANAEAFRRFYSELSLADEGNEELARDLKENGVSDKSRPRQNRKKKTTPDGASE